MNWHPCCTPKGGASNGAARYDPPTRSRQRAPNLPMLDRLVLGLTTLFVSPHRIPKLSASLKPATLFKFHKALVHRKYRLLFSSSCRRRKPGPKGPSAQLIAAIVEMKHRNPKFGCVRTAQQIGHAFRIEIDKHSVPRVVAKHFRPEPGADGPSWLTPSLTRRTASGVSISSALNPSFC